ncbi:hypothetical protein QBC41DRAFT_227572 [Cercophora samala]|uniref:BTB domain-containing protein n=1 Tax=Cercophora samala TaxID=330535 RepID=A0AA40DBQ9_9PEZI|nr:hypothetical protein QBC41DRAFT_227572 [Cercophora samala]
MDISELRKTFYQDEIIDPDGDLFLHVGPTLRKGMGGTGQLSESVTRFQVCSATLRRASKFFRTMLFGPWSTSKPSDPCAKWVVDLPEDDNDAMGVILAILHGSFDKIPLCPTGSFQRQFDVDLVYDIVVAVDKYDLFHVTQPFLAKWIAYVSTHGEIDTWTQRWLLETAWIVGDEVVFASEIKQLVLHSSIEEATGELTCSGEHRRRWVGYFDYGVKEVDFKDESVDIEGRLIGAPRPAILPQCANQHTFATSLRTCKAHPSENVPVSP